MPRSIDQSSRPIAWPRGVFIRQDETVCARRSQVGRTIAFAPWAWVIDDGTASPSPLKQGAPGGRGPCRSAGHRAIKPSRRHSEAFGLARLPSPEGGPPGVEGEGDVARLREAHALRAKAMVPPRSSRTARRPVSPRPSTRGSRSPSTLCRRPCRGRRSCAGSSCRG
jgi:hypothetical protein